MDIEFGAQATFSEELGTVQRQMMDADASDFELVCYSLLRDYIRASWECV